ncbi:MAG: hypothetical protein QM726_11000 [Chitinophagaceae bacterium]
MTYRLPYKGLSKQASLFIVVVMTALLLLFFIEILLQRRNQNNVRLKSINGIITNKRNLKRGSFGFVVRQNQHSQEYDMSGYDYFFDKIEVGDSVSKQKDTYYFDVYRKDNFAFKYMVTIGYK